MKLTFKDLKQQKFTIDAEPEETIGQVKEKIASEKGWDASSQKLIYSGKILADANTVEQCKLEEKGFIVCMISKPKAAPAAAKQAPPETPAVSTSTPAQPPAPQAQSTAIQPEVPATPTPAQSTATTGAPAQPGDSGFGDPNALLLGNQGSAAVREMESMGFARPEIDRAMRAAFGNPDRAIEYLLTGIPETAQQEQRQPTPGAGAQAPQAATSPAPTATLAETAPTGGEEINLFEAAAQAGRAPGGTGAGAGLAAGAGAGAGGQMNMEFLRNSPHFQQLRQLVQQQPAMLEPLLQQIAEANPQLAQMIGQNQDEFLRLLAEDAGGDGLGEAGLPPGSHAIQVTEEEREAIERLCRLGFSRDQVIQAYFACDKNEELAANFLFDQPDDEEQ